ncbi:hypothetical protein M405DRAFT_95651 [Rhizopogon salebrosus TDB-379]|nr:hypothetical protein M405DRAFT_95651 [Rhizopogon salebrosus TDB-379]
MLEGTDARVDPMHRALAVWGLTGDKFSVLSIHRTSTGVNEKNETQIWQNILTMSRTHGDVVLSICSNCLEGCRRPCPLYRPSESSPSSVSPSYLRHRSQSKLAFRHRSHTTTDESTGHLLARLTTCNDEAQSNRTNASDRRAPEYFNRMRQAIKG